jgi:hypothetical protein
MACFIVYLEYQAEIFTSMLENKELPLRPGVAKV